METLSLRGMETSSTVFKALDALTIVTARADGISLPDLALALNQPRSNVVRIIRTLQQYGFVSCAGRHWIATATFRAWGAPPNRHDGFRRRYRPVLEAIAAASGELVMLGLQEGNGIIHIDAVESAHRLCRTPVPEIRHSLRYNAMGKLALSRRPDLALKFPSPAFQQELEEIRRTRVAWNRGETDRALVGMAIPGFSNLPTEPMLAIMWPIARFTEAGAERTRQVAAEALDNSLRAGDPSPLLWTSDQSPSEIQRVPAA
jgi:DNA-binding IclR family transcriptional regulator